jgi:hypothetical protein
VTLLTVVAATVFAAAPAAAADTGYVRLAHLSPDTPAVDVYLSSQSGAVAEKVFPAVAYGALSDYLRLPTGGYAVAMRKAGAPRSEAPVLTTQVTVASGGAYTVAGVGRYADLGLRVLDDDLSLPPDGRAKVRVVQASVRSPVLGVAVTDGPTLGTGIAFATTTGYNQVEPGRWTLRVQPSGGARATTLPVTLAAGSVYSLLILDGGNGGLVAELHTDAGRQGGVPSGGVETGAGGAGRPSGGRLLLIGALLAVLAAMVVAGVRPDLARR